MISKGEDKNQLSKILYIHGQNSFIFANQKMLNYYFVLPASQPFYLYI